MQVNKELSLIPFYKLSCFAMILVVLSVVGCSFEQKTPVQTKTQITLDTLGMNDQEKTLLDSLLVEQSGVYYGFKNDGYYVLINLFYNDSVYFGTVSLNGEELLPFSFNESRSKNTDNNFVITPEVKFTISEGRDSGVVSVSKRRRKFDIPLTRKFVFGSYKYQDSLISVSGFYPQYLVKKYGAVSLNNSLRENTLSVLTNNVTDQLSLLQDTSISFKQYSMNIAPEITYYSPIMFSYIINFSEELSENNSIHWFETDNYEIGNESIVSLSLETFIGADSLSRAKLLENLNKKLIARRGGKKLKFENPVNFEDLLNYVFDNKKITFIYPSRKSYKTETRPWFFSVPYSTLNISDSSEAFISNFLLPSGSK